MESTADRSVELCLSEGKSLRLARETLVRPLLLDCTEAPSVGRSTVESPFASTEFLGLSDFRFPGILDRKERKDFDESLVSDREKDGYDWSPSPPFELPSLEDWLPMVSVIQVGKTRRPSRYAAQWRSYRYRPSSRLPTLVWGRKVGRWKCQAAVNLNWRQLWLKSRQSSPVLWRVE